MGLELKAARRLVKKKKANTWGVEQLMEERSIVDATATTKFVYANTGLAIDVVVVKAKMIDMEVLGVSGRVALYEIIIAKEGQDMMPKIMGPAIRNEYTYMEPT